MNPFEHLQQIARLLEENRKEDQKIANFRQKKTSLQSEYKKAHRLATETHNKLCAAQTAKEEIERRGDEYRERHKQAEFKASVAELEYIALKKARPIWLVRIFSSSWANQLTQAGNLFHSTQSIKKSTEDDLAKHTITLQKAIDKVQRIHDDLTKFQEQEEYSKQLLENKSRELEAQQASAVERKEANGKKIDNILQNFRDLSMQIPQPDNGLAASVPWGHFTILGAPCLAQIKLPLSFALYSKQTEKSVQSVLWLIRDILHYSTPGTVRLTAIDTYTMGKDFRALFTTPPITEGGKIITDIKEAASTLNDFVEDIADIRRDLLGQKYADWNECRKQTSDRLLPYKILLIANIQDLFAEGSPAVRKNLSAILREGPQTGILPICIYSPLSDTKKQAEIMNLLKDGKNKDILSIPNYLAKIEAQFPMLECRWNPLFPKGYRGDITEKLQQEAQHCNIAENSITLLLKTSCTPRCAKQGLTVPVGWDASTGSPVIFPLDDAHPHAFIGGQTGMGKSNFMHVLLNTWIACYSADELEIYILDFKEGVEMNVYAQHRIPNVKLVADRCDMVFATSLLEHLKNISDERAKKFLEAGVNNYEKYREKTGERLSRIILLVDECQNLFNQNSLGDSQRIADMASHLVRTGRSQGIHLVLSCQSLSGMTWNNPQLWRNIRVRVALKCEATESGKILATENRAAASIIARKQAVVNDDDGNPGGNRITNIPLADPTDDAVLRHLNEHNDPHHTVRKYTGATPLTIPSTEEFAQLSAANTLWLGNAASFRVKPFLLPLMDKAQQLGTAILACMGNIDALLGLRQAVFLSAEYASDIDSVIRITRNTNNEDHKQDGKLKTISADELTAEQWQDILTPTTEETKKIVYIEDIDRLQDKLKFPDTFTTNKDKFLLGNMLKNALEAVDTSNVFIIADMRRLPDAGLLKELRKPFSTIIAQGIPSDDVPRLTGRLDLRPEHIGTDEEHRSFALILRQDVPQYYQAFFRA